MNRPVTVVATVSLSSLEDELINELLDRTVIGMPEFYDPVIRAFRSARGKNIS